ncbi:MAG: sensor domain-containing protein [Actinomycetota bacterium]|nr:sensor domain-containing protein [Actinomycetota bacterium]
MNKSLATEGGYHAAIMYDNHFMNRPPASRLGHLLTALFTKRAWAELLYSLITFPLAVAAFVFTVAGIGNGPLWAVSAPGVRKFGAASRFFAGQLLGEQVPAPPQLRPRPSVRVATPDPARLAEAVAKAGAKSRKWAGRSGISVRNLPPARVAELAAEAGVTVDSLQSSEKLAWYAGALQDNPAWRARIYIAAKLPLAGAGIVAVAAGWLGGLFLLTYPAWRQVAPIGPIHGFQLTNLASSFLLVPAGAALLLAAPWLTHYVTTADLYLIRGLLGPHSAAERVRALEESRARVVDDSAARLRGIERDLHDGTQAQLVALAMKLGLAKEKLGATAPVDLARITQLVDDAHRSAVAAIAELRTVTRGIHPPVLDNGLADALATLAARSAVPVELVTDIPERPTAAIETIGYFSAAELLTNVAKHSGGRHATLEAVHVPGLLRIRVTDDGRGGAHPTPDGGLSGLAERIRPVDGRLHIASPRGGPTVITVELPSHA